MEDLQTAALPTHEYRISDSSATIWLYLGRFDHQRGQILGTLLPAPHSCALSQLEEEAGRSFEYACMVVNVALTDPQLLRHGYGIQLYAGLARVAAERFDAPILSSTLWGHSISEEAARVWKSRRLARAVTVRGRGAWNPTLPSR